ncbi:MAG: GumC family protein [Rhizobiaceae bacterium]
MRSEWDMPQPAHGTARSQRSARHAASPRTAMPQAQDGVVDPMALIGLVTRNWLQIAIVAAVLTAICVGALLLYPFPYKATAIVLADPRDQRVTLQEDVLPAIGSDAAVLESMIQIVKSDGFLLATMQELGLMGAPDELSQTERLTALAKFRRKLAVDRKGATYLVEISYSADGGEEAAQIANGVAHAFADSQNQSRSVATENAAKSLSTRLVEMRAKLNDAEEAVQQFKAENGIVFVDQNNTLQMRQLTELSQQLALAKNATEEARARYDEVKNGGSISISSQQTGEGGQLAFLRQQRSELTQSLEQQRQIYGPRHPRIQQTQQMVRGVDAQITQERQLLEQQLKATLDVAAAKQAELERQIGSLSSGVNLTEAAQVKLDALEREAAANREIYQQFLSRNKQTDELALMIEDNVRIVSEAVPPLRSTRPSITLVGPAIAMLSLAIAAFVAVGRDFGSIAKRDPRPMPAHRHPAPAERAAYSRTARRPAPDIEDRPSLPAKQRPVHDPVSLLDAWGEPGSDAKQDPVELLREQRDRLRAGSDMPTRTRRDWRRAG